MVEDKIMTCGLRVPDKCRAPVKPNLHFFGEPIPESVKHGLQVATGKTKYVPMENPIFSDFYITNTHREPDLLIIIGSNMTQFPQLISLNCPKVMISE